MDAVPFGSPESVVVSVAGAALALAGAGMLLRSRDRPVRAAAAFGVFLVGAGFLLLPWFAGGRAGGEPPAAAPDPVALAPDGITVSADGLRTVARPGAPAPPPPLPGRPAARITIEASEAEPNDNLAVANTTALGTAVEGILEPGDLDYFAVDVPEGTRGEVVVNLLAVEGDCELTLFDDAGQALGTVQTRSALSARAANLVRKIDRPRYHVLVLAVADGRASYQLTVAARRR
jgi:hypothetical protein